MSNYKELRKQWPKGDINAVCHAVAEIYVNALNSGLPPKVAVMKAFNTPPATAGRMIAKARELGILKTANIGGRPSTDTAINQWEVQQHEPVTGHPRYFQTDFTNAATPGLQVRITCYTTQGDYPRIVGCEINTDNMKRGMTAAELRGIPYGHLSALAASTTHKKAKPNDYR